MKKKFMNLFIGKTTHINYINERLSSKLIKTTIENANNHQTKILVEPRYYLYSLLYISYTDGHTFNNDVKWISPTGEEKTLNSLLASLPQDIIFNVAVFKSNSLEQIIPVFEHLKQNKIEAQLTQNSSTITTTYFNYINALYEGAKFAQKNNLLINWISPNEEFKNNLQDVTNKLTPFFEKEKNFKQDKDHTL